MEPRKSLVSVLTGVYLWATIFCQGCHGGVYQRKLYHDVLVNYNRLERPVQNDSAPIVVDLGLTLLQIIDVDEKNQVLITNAWLQLMNVIQENRLDFDFSNNDPDLTDFLLGLSLCLLHTRKELVLVLQDFVAVREDEFSVFRGEKVQILASNQQGQSLVYRPANSGSPAAEGWVSRSVLHIH